MSQTQYDSLVSNLLNKKQVLAQLRAELEGKRDTKARNVPSRKKRKRCREKEWCM